MVPNGSLHPQGQLRRLFFHILRWTAHRHFEGWFDTVYNILKIKICYCLLPYSEVPNRRADRNRRAGLEKSATLLAYLLRKSINEQGGIFCLLHEKLRAGWKENLKNLSEHALL